MGNFDVEVNVEVEANLVVAAFGTIALRHTGRTLTGDATDRRNSLDPKRIGQDILSWRNKRRRRKKSTQLTSQFSFLRLGPVGG